MEKWWFNSRLLNRKFEYRCELSKSMESLGPIENTSLSEEPKILTDIDKKIQRWDDRNNSSYNSFEDTRSHVLFFL